MQFARREQTTQDEHNSLKKKTNYQSESIRTLSTKTEPRNAQEQTESTWP
jgi:hypothetical protein